jgi:uncharacterized membrane protein
MRLALAIVLLLAACSEQAPEKKAQAPDDNCVGYIIKPDGSKDCLERGK